MSPASNTESYPAFAHIGLRENPVKKLYHVTCPDLESNPGHLVLRLDALTRLRLHPYLLQLLQALIPEDKVLRRNFCTSIQTLIENDDEFIRSVVFSDDVTFQLSVGCVQSPNLDAVDVWLFVAGGSAMHNRFSTGLMVTHATGLRDRGEAYSERIGEEMSEGIEIGRGVRQGCPLSPTLFNIYLEDIVNNYFQTMGGVIVGERRIKFTRFADDMALLAEEEMILKDMLLELNDSCEQYGMKINTIRRRDGHRKKIQKTKLPILTEAEKQIEVNKVEQRSYVKISIVRGRNARQCHSELLAALGDSALKHSPYSPDLSPCDFDLILQLKKPLRVKRFANREDILTAFRREVVRTDESHTVDSIQRLNHRWQGWELS
ncbi:hypothetical protein ANN_13005 [Periplaneta americana]|uniref:Reverse transcriptase domain-containing protein n=1 Tax=Periplaneta americana TaxID=6978 RepID=A0ABQ8TKW6_PERAM|nr:hypothetical protein ANN_13005 [Periplaneta americana]